MPLSVAHFTPYPWDGRHETNDFVLRSAEELASRGHSVVIAAPSVSRERHRRDRADVKRLVEGGAPLVEPGAPPRVMSMAGGVPLPRGPRTRPAPVPVDAGRTVETLLGHGGFDVVHVHEPFAPSLSSVALRNSFSLNVGTFHQPTERLFTTQVARPVVEIFFGRLDARTVASRATAELLNRYFPGSYELTTPGAEAAEPARADDGVLRIGFSDLEERGALRLFLRALRRLPSGLRWEAVIHSESPSEVPVRAAKAIRDRVRVVGPEEAGLAEALAGCDVLVAASGGPDPAPAVVRQAMASGAVPVVSDVPVYDELVRDGERGLLFPAGDTITLAGQIERLATHPALMERVRRSLAPDGRARTWADVADEFEAIYERAVARRHDPAGKPAVRRRLAERPLIDVDLHMHTDHSPDCATPVEVLIETARDRGFGAIAITDHNEVSGAHAAREVAAGMEGFKVIVAEEVKTAEQGEVIGLFIEERIPKGLTMAETIAEIKRQGGLVYVPHPFDRLHSVPDYEHLLDIIEDVDLIEVFNPRVTISAFNEEAERFARKYRIVPAAGSDSHVAQGLGSVRIRMRDFDGPEEFLESMRDAEITRRHKNMLYVQALKFLQTTGRPKAPKRSVPQARPAKGGRPKRRGATRARRSSSKT